MSKKDYIQFADMFADIHKYIDNSFKATRNANEKQGMLKVLAMIQDEASTIFKNDNYNFDAYRFSEYINNKVLAS